MRIPVPGAADMHNTASSWRASVFPQRRGRNDPAKKHSNIINDISVYNYCYYYYYSIFILKYVYRNVVQDLLYFYFYITVIFVLKNLLQAFSFLFICYYNKT